MKRILVFLIMMVVSVTPVRAAEWMPLPGSFSELGVQALAIDPLNAKRLYAAAGPSFYRSEDGGASWKKSLALKGEGNRITDIFLQPNAVYVATEQGAQISADGGKHWKKFFKGKDLAKKVYCVNARAQEPDAIWLGTGAGLFVYDRKTGSFKKAESFPSVAVYSILFGDKDNSRIMAATEKGIYAGREPFASWERIHSSSSEENPLPEEAESLEQFGIEEFYTTPAFSNIIYLEGDQQFYAATNRGVLASKDSSSWSALQGQKLPDHKINFIEGSGNAFYAATDQGVFQWQQKSSLFRELEGIPCKKVNALAYSQSGDFLLAGTEKGIFKLLYPEINFSTGNSEMRQMKAKNYLRQFEHEPTIHQIQSAAIAYGEVHPSKINNWRRAAAMKALMPQLSLDTDISENQNIDLDRGGTNDPDRFIFGPEEKSRDWSVGVSWDLSDIVWNESQTSIDTRSRLMVQLREDILNQVTHLYFERRKLQIEMLLSPPKELPLQIEKRLRLDELTAEIDALTGGYLTERMKS